MYFALPSPCVTSIALTTHITAALAAAKLSTAVQKRLNPRRLMTSIINQRIPLIISAGTMLLSISEKFIAETIQYTATVIMI